MKCLEEKESAQPPSQSALQTLAEENRYTLALPTPLPSNIHLFLPTVLLHTLLHMHIHTYRQLKLQLVEVQAERDQAHARIDRYKVTQTSFFLSKMLSELSRISFLFCLQITSTLRLFVFDGFPLQRAVDRRKTQETQQLQSASLGKHNSEWSCLRHVTCTSNLLCTVTYLLVLIYSTALIV